MSVDTTKIFSLLDLTVDDLLVRLSSDIDGFEAFSPAEDDDIRKARARVWLMRHLMLIKDQLCEQDLLQRYERADDEGKIAVAASIADVVATVTGKVPVFTAVALLIKLGHRKVCSDESV